ncbi:MAG: hypothetical protein NTY74_09060 [Ignavibacteriae bacterium]|nr:hypothetical protein [Ignavibacteriota bacterium]
MNGDKKYFEQKFNECSKYLKAKPNNLVSLKYREIRDHESYNELLDKLKNIEGLEIKSIGNVMNGVAYNISYGEQNIIIVEHETGLEILYIAGSIAGIIGLVLQVGSMINNHRRMTPFHHEIRETEIRYFDKKGNFIEERRTNYLPYEAFLLPQSSKEIKLLKKRIDNLEKEITWLKSKGIKDKTKSKV